MNSEAPKAGPDVTAVEVASDFADAHEEVSEVRNRIRMKVGEETIGGRPERTINWSKEGGTLSAHRILAQIDNWAGHFIMKACITVDDGADLTLIQSTLTEAYQSKKISGFEETVHDDKQGFLIHYNYRKS